MTLTKAVMSSKLTTLNASNSLVEAFHLMSTKHIRHLPVTDGNGHIVGILSDRDIQRAMSVKRLSAFEQSATLDPALRVEDFMSWPVYVVGEATTLKKAAQEMLAQKVSALLVQNDAGHISGIVTTDDFLKLYAMDRSKEADIALGALTQYFTGPELY